jgi:hypothetical protein
MNPTAEPRFSWRALTSRVMAFAFLILAGIIQQPSETP